MRSRIGAGASLIAAAAVGALAATSLAGEDAEPTALRAGDLRQVVAEEVAPGRARGGLALRAAGRRGQTLSYLQTPKSIDIPPGAEEAVEVGKCPKRSKAVTGYFATGNPGTFLDLSRPSTDSPRKWAIGAYNGTSTADKAIFGIVCLSRVK